MTPPLQPMDTAPRTGEEVWLMLKGNATLVKCKWVDDDMHECWFNGGIPSYDDEDAIGWLDIAALVRDSERLDFLESEPVREEAWSQLQIEAVVRADYGKDYNTPRPNSLFRRNQPITRATIDKEAGRG